jgi:hypothetical protein
MIRLRRTPTTQNFMCENICVSIIVAMRWCMLPLWFENTCVIKNSVLSTFLSSSHLHLISPHLHSDAHMRMITHSHELADFTFMISSRFCDGWFYFACWRVVMILHDAVEEWMRPMAGRRVAFVTPSILHRHVSIQPTYKLDVYNHIALTCPMRILM